MTPLEVILGGGGLVALFRWLTSRDRLAQQATTQVIKTLEAQLEAKTRELETRLRTVAEDAERRVVSANARADTADLESARFRSERDAERLRREQAEHERDGLRVMVDGLRDTINGALVRLGELESENRDLRKELARDTQDESPSE